MDVEAWLALTAAFVLGAMSPGPSLAVVLRSTLAGGRRRGVMTGVGHGIGFGIYAVLAALGMASALALHPATDAVLRWGGTALLVWLGVSFVAAARKGPASEPAGDPHASSGRAGFAQGFLIAIFNPKILAWMVAVYAPFIEADLAARTLLGMGLLGMCIDGSWYVTVATLLSRGNRIARLRASAHRIDGALGVLMLAFAVVLASGAF